jgi:archaellum component FlaC
MTVESIALFIPILALSIPIVAIIANAMTKKYKNGPDQTAQVEKLEKRVLELEESLSQVNGDVERLEDRQNFISRLLEDKS